MASRPSANREALASLRRIERPPDRAVTVLGHLIGAQWLWLGRLRDEPEPGPVWPELALDGCATQLDALEAAWGGWLIDAGDGNLCRIVGYTNSQGEPWTSTVEDILMHVLHHSAYHRGQLASHLRDAGHDPASTDFIHCIRQGHVP